MTTLTDREVIERAKTMQHHPDITDALLDVLAAANRGPCRHDTNYRGETCETCTATRYALALLRLEVGGE